MRFTLVCAAMAVVASASAQIYSNGPFVTHPGGGFGGADASRLQNVSLGMGTLGVGLGQATNVWVADDFVVPTGQTWNITGFSGFGYQTNGATTNLLTDLRLMIFGGGNPNTGALLFGDTTTNRLTSSTFTNSFRDTENTVGNSARAIMRANANVGLNLTAGTYWAAWALNGSFNPAGAVFCPPVTITGLGGKPGANALQSQTGGGFGTYTFNVTDGSTLVAQDMPFLLHGTVVPEPASMIALGLGAAALIRRRRRN